ncbi:hypothetical protein D3C72_1640800 [compost metagenome]
MESVRFGAQVFICGRVALGFLNPEEGINDRATSFSSLDQPCDGAGFLTEHNFYVLGNLNLREFFCQTPMIVFVTLSHAAPVKALGDDRVGDA